MKNTTTLTEINVLVTAIATLQNDNDYTSEEAGWFRHFDTLSVLEERLDELVESYGGMKALPYETKDNYFDIIEDVSDVI